MARQLPHRGAVTRDFDGHGPVVADTLGHKQESFAMSTALEQWEYENSSRWRRKFGQRWQAIRRPLGVPAIALVAFLLGLHAASAPYSPLADIELRARLHHAEIALKAREGELELARMEMARLMGIMEYSEQHAIPADLSRAIYDIALSEGIDPGLAHRLVRVESGFFPRAISHAGAVGLAQVMPATAFELDPSLGYSDLFDRETNLRLGFRYLRLMLEKYDGDMRLALLAYNRGPGTVDRVLRQGGDPSNGYEHMVLGSN